MNTSEYIIPARVSRSRLRKTESVIISTKAKCRCLKCYISRNGKEKILTRIRNNCELDLKTECWIWKLVCNPQGYPNASFGRKTYGVQRTMWIVLDKDPLGPKDVVYQTCGNIKCCNPDHSGLSDRSLFTTVKTKHRRKISNEIILKLRNLKEKGYSLSKLHKMFNIDKRFISRIINNQTYKHLL